MVSVLVSVAFSERGIKTPADVCGHPSGVAAGPPSARAPADATRSPDVPGAHGRRRRSFLRPSAVPLPGRFSRSLEPLGVGGPAENHPDAAERVQGHAGGAEEYGVGRGSWEMFKDIVDPFGVHEAVEPPAAGGSVCPPMNCA